MKTVIIVLIATPWVGLLAGCGVASSSPRIPEESVKMYLQGKSAYSQGDLETALPCFRNSAASSPSFYQARLMIAKTLFFTGEVGEAETVLQRLLKEHPRFREAELMLVRLYLHRDRLPEAEEHLTRMLSYDSTDPRLLYVQARVCEERKDYAAALDYLRQARLFAEEYARMMLDLGRIYYRFDRKRAAVRELETALHLLSPESPLRAPVEKLRTSIVNRIDNREEAP